MEKNDYAPVSPPGMDEYNLKATLEAAQDELVKLLRDRESMEWRINKLQNDIVHLSALCRVEVEDPIKQLGLTDAVRFILGMNKKPMTIPQIVDELRKSSYDVSEYKNLPANIHTIVGRLIKANEVRPFAGQPPFNNVFIWIGGLPPMPPPAGWLKERMKKS